MKKLTKHYENLKQKQLLVSDRNSGFTSRLGLLAILLLIVFAVSVQDSHAKRYDEIGQHRATLIDINGNILDYDSPRYAKIADDGGISVHIDDSLALVALYHSMSGVHWRNNNGWLEEKVEFWVGVQTVTEVDTDEWRVTSFRVPNENMTRVGTIPPEIEKMVHLDLFRVQSNLLVGSIPAELAKIPTLRVFWPQRNYLSGEVPWKEFGQMQRLADLVIRFNFLSGEIPSWFGENDDQGNPYFPVIQLLMIEGNNFHGQIPASLANRTLFRRVTVANNQFTGPIPDLSTLEDLRFLFLHDNDFEPGPIPEWLRQLPNLERLSLANTNRTGTIPDWFGEITSLERMMGGGIGGNDEIGGEIPESMRFMPNLWDFSLTGGNFTGPIPEWIADIPSLQIVDFQDVKFTGTLPASFSTVDDLRRVFISGSLIEGGIPESWQVLTRLQVLDLSNNLNMEIGNIPEWIAQNLTDLQELYLPGSGVTGEIPANFETLGGLQRLSLGNNPGLTGELPAWLADKDLRQLSLSNTGMTITEIPAWLQNSTRLDALELGGYGIEGPIPEWLGNENLAATLRRLALDDNKFSGEIPAALGNLFVLDSLNLANNELTGSIPVEFLNIGKPNPEFSVLQAIVLSGNAGLTGEMLLFEDALDMRVVEFDGTDLCVPTGFDAWADVIENTATQRYPVLYFNISTTGINCSDLPSNVEFSDLPDRVRLGGNYPNPFNPSTTIPFSLPHDMQVSLRVYNILGQHVATLVNERLTSGRHEVRFDAANLSSGYYVYRLETEEGLMINQMILLK